MTSSEIELVDLRSLSDAAKRRALCNAFYDEVYRAAFPKPDQSESPEIWLPLMEAPPAPPEPLLRVIVARWPDGGMAGGVVVEYFRASRAALITYIVTVPLTRRQGLARRLLNAAVAYASADNGGSAPYVFGEVERPEAQQTQEGRQVAEIRLAAISGLGGRRLEFNYVQPSLGPGKQPATDLMLVMFSQDDGRGSLPAADLRAFIDEFFVSLQQKGGEEHQQVIQSLQGDRVAIAAIGAS